ncbi:MAG: ATP-binding cassette domain-containing protein [Phycisphaerae bacterium]|nr:ATP-binding cassette domain-containing protein [Phycisphaerae bacterium]MDW8261850.1 ATP-binding cassette domain-containing protein [Phycisphaerales bacterium]
MIEYGRADEDCLPMNAVEMEHVTKTFGATVAVDDLSLAVPVGSIYGFIGPNGSGKTTTLRMIMRIYLPDRGTIRVLGQEHGGVLDQVTYLPEERMLYKSMKVYDVLRFFARLKNYDPTPAEIDQWLDRMQLSGWGDKKVEALSKGMTQKVQLIATLISRPKLVLLDEPFSGLDPVNAVVLRDAILDLRKSGTTVIFSTHDMNVAEKLCDFIFMIYRGRKVLDGTLADIQRQYGRDTIRVRVAPGSNGVLRALPGVISVVDHGNLQELRLSSDADARQILRILAQQCIVEHFEVAAPNLHDIFVRIASPTEVGEKVMA